MSRHDLELDFSSDGGAMEEFLVQSHELIQSMC